MKLSNKVLLGFFGIIFLYLTAAFAELRLKGTSRVIDDKNSVAETVDLSGISHVIINDLEQYVRVLGSDRARLEVKSVSGGLLRKLKYQISGDTLTLSGFQSDGNSRVNISVFVSSTTLKGVTVNRSAASIGGLHQDALLLSQNSGRISMSDSKIANVQMDLSNRSFLDITDSALDTLSATIDGSGVNVLSPVGLVRGSMKNNASMQLNRTREIQLKEDEKSKLTVYQ